MRKYTRLKHLDVNMHGTTAAAASGASHTQTNLTSFTRRRCDPAWSEKMTQLITAMTSQDMLPLNFVEGKGFSKFMEYVEPQYTVTQNDNLPFLD